VLIAHQHQGNLGEARHPVGDAAEERTRHATPAVRAHDNDIGIPTFGVTQQRMGNIVCADVGANKICRNMRARTLRSDSRRCAASAIAISPSLTKAFSRSVIGTKSL
jgi:hypothetical protein